MDVYQIPSLQYLISFDLTVFECYRISWQFCQEDIRMGILSFHNFALIIKTKLCTKIYPKLCFLNRLSHFLSHEMLLKIYKQTILPAIDYGSIIWIDCSKVMSDKLERLQNQAPRSIPKKGQKDMHPVVTQKMSFALSKKPQTFLTFPTRF